MCAKMIHVHNKNLELIRQNEVLREQNSRFKVSQDKLTREKRELQEENMLLAKFNSLQERVFKFEDWWKVNE